MKGSVAMPRSWFYHFVRVLASVELVFYAAIFIDLLLHPTGPDIAGNPALARLSNALISAPAILALGVLVLRRTKGNLIGWLLVLWGAEIGAGAIRVEAFGWYAAELNLFSLCLWPVLWAIPIHFPDGEPYPRRLGWVAQGVIAATIILLLLVSYGSPVMDSFIPLRAGTPNRFYVSLFSPFRSLLTIVNFAPFLTLMGILIISITLRFRASHGRERQQLKYMLWAAALLIIFILIGEKISGEFITNVITLADLRSVLYFIGNVIFPLLPVAGIALPILRHRLYDIDIIIRRTVTYTIVTGLLLAVYFGGVVVLQQVFVAITGQRSEAAIILSTLIIAALSVPLRNRIQTLIDRRFYRRKYNAERVLESFALEARDETDPNRLSMHLLDVVDETMQPVQVILWVNDLAQIRDKGVNEAGAI